MTPSPDLAPSVEDHHLARDIAEEAGRRLRVLRERGDRNLGALGDRLSNEYILGALADSRPGDSVLSEEGLDDRLRLQADRVWIVDPLDGTREFAERGRTDWAVHVALWQRVRGDLSGPATASPDGALVVGAVALPAQGITLSTAQAPRVPARDPSRQLRIAVSRTRPPEFAVLREALRETAAALQQGRAAELESERLRAFREVARRVVGGLEPARERGFVGGVGVHLYWSSKPRQHSA